MKVRSLVCTCVACPLLFNAHPAANFACSSGCTSESHAHAPVKARLAVQDLCQRDSDRLPAFHGSGAVEPGQQFIASVTKAITGRESDDETSI